MFKLTCCLALILPVAFFILGHALAIH